MITKRNGMFVHVKKKKRFVASEENCWRYRSPMSGIVFASSDFDYKMLKSFRWPSWVSERYPTAREWSNIQYTIRSIHNCWSHLGPVDGEILYWEKALCAQQKVTVFGGVFGKIRNISKTVQFFKNINLCGVLT